MGTCKDCRFWGADALTGPVSTGIFRECKSEKLIHGYGFTDEEVREQHGGDVADCARVENDEGWAFAPGPDFGCIHHEPNPQPGTGEP
jgi:hypothetical protein